MLLKYELDIKSDSIWIFNTPTDFAAKLPFYFNECGKFYAQQRYYTIRKGKHDFLLVFTLSGRGGLEYQGKSFDLTENKCVIVDCRERSYFFSKSERWTYYWMHFNGSAVKGMLENVLSAGEFPVNVKNPSLIEAEMLHIFSLSKTSDIESCLKISQSISTILSTLILNNTALSQGEKSNNYDREITMVCEYIDKNYAQRITIEDMHLVAHMSKYYFIRVFKKYVGLPPYEYLQTIRVNKAKHLLLFSSNSISDIATLTGFTDTNGFIKAFKEKVGETPLQYRKKEL